jgi:hypothetical protein
MSKSQDSVDSKDSNPVLSMDHVRAALLEAGNRGATIQQLIDRLAPNIDPAKNNGKVLGQRLGRLSGNDEAAKRTIEDLEIWFATDNTRLSEPTFVLEPWQPSKKPRKPRQPHYHEESSDQPQELTDEENGSGGGNNLRHFPRSTVSLFKLYAINDSVLELKIDGVWTPMATLQNILVQISEQENKDWTEHHIFHNVESVRIHSWKGDEFGPILEESVPEGWVVTLGLVTKT